MRLEFIKKNKEIICVYIPDYDSDVILKQIKEQDETCIKGTFFVNKSDLRELEDFDEESICFSIGSESDEYIHLKNSIFNITHNFYFFSDINLKKDMFIANNNISIVSKIDDLIDSDVYIGGREKESDYYIPFEDYNNLIKHFPNTYELKLYARSRIASILKEYVSKIDKYENIYIKYIEKKEKAFGDGKDFVINEEYYNKIELEQFEVTLNEFKLLLDNSFGIDETTWQKRVQKILKILYPQYILYSREITFKGIDGYDKRPDFTLVNMNGFIDVMEIKLPTERVISKNPSYRNNYVPSRVFSNGIQQIEKYILCLSKLNEERDAVFSKLSNKLPENVKPQVVNPQGIFLIGRSNNFNEQQKRDFELIKRQYKNIADIMTYDDLIIRFENIINALKRNLNTESD